MTHMSDVFGQDMRRTLATKLKEAEHGAEAFLADMILQSGIQWGERFTLAEFELTLRSAIEETIGPEHSYTRDPGGEGVDTAIALAYLHILMMSERTFY